MELEKAEAWLGRAEETFVDACNELEKAPKRGKKRKEVQGVWDWAKSQMEQAAEAVVLAQAGLNQPQADEDVNLDIESEPQATVAE